MVFLQFSDHLSTGIICFIYVHGCFIINVTVGLWTIALGKLIITNLWNILYFFSLKRSMLFKLEILTLGLYEYLRISMVMSVHLLFNCASK